MLGVGGPTAVAASLVAKLVAGPVAIPIVVAGGTYLLAYWRKRVSLARELGPAVRRALLNLRSRHGYRDVVVVAHSLGAELAWSMIPGARKVPFDRLVLLGGASSATDGYWSELELDAPIYNVRNGRDRILQLIYRVVELEHPVGLGPVGGRIIDADASHLELPFGGHDYRSVFDHWEAPHRWRPAHFGWSGEEEQWPGE